MKLTFINVAIILILSIILCSQVTHAKPFGNRWHATDPRCAGGYYPGIRLKRLATTNNSGKNCYRFNPNHDTCEKNYECSDTDYQTFASHGECERNCLDVYHFS